MQLIACVLFRSTTWLQSLLVPSTLYSHPPTFPRIGFFVVYVMLTLGVIGYITHKGLSNVIFLYGIVLAVIMLAPPFACLLFFFLATHSISLCYDDWAAKMLSTTTASLRDCAKVDLLLDRLSVRTFPDLVCNWLLTRPNANPPTYSQPNAPLSANPPTYSPPNARLSADPPTYSQPNARLSADPPTFSQPNARLSYSRAWSSSTCSTI